MAGQENLFYGFVLIVFFAVAAGTMYIIYTNIGTNDNKASVITAIQNISITNGVLIALLTFISFMFLRGRPVLQENYTLYMTHINLFISLTALSIATIVQLSTA